MMEHATLHLEVYGNALVGHLVRAGAKVFVTDTDMEAVRRVMSDYRVEAIAADKIYDVDCDVFAPCAMGNIINEETIPRLKCSMIAGAANNQLGDEKRDGKSLQDRYILYSPDFVINAGWLVNVSNELEGYNQERALDQAEGIYDILRDIFQHAEEEDIPTYRAANNLAMQRIESIGRIRRTFTGGRPQGTRGQGGTGSAFRGIT